MSRERERKLIVARAESNAALCRVQERERKLREAALKLLSLIWEENFEHETETAYERAVVALRAAALSAAPARGGISEMPPNDVVGCHCDEFPERAHSLYWYMGCKAAKEEFAPAIVAPVAADGHSDYHCTFCDGAHYESDCPNRCDPRNAAPTTGGEAQVTDLDKRMEELMSQISGVYPAHGAGFVEIFKPDARKYIRTAFAAAEERILEEAKDWLIVVKALISNPRGHERILKECEQRVADMERAHRERAPKP